MADTWYGTAEVVAVAAIVGNAYPLRFSGLHDASSTVEFDVSEPSEAVGFIGQPLLRQRVDLRVTGDERVAVEVALETLRQLTDLLALFSSRAARYDLASLTTAPPGAVEGSFRTLPIFQEVPARQDPFRLPPSYLENVWKSIGRLGDDQGPRVARSIRWYRRATGAADEYDEFACLMFGYEALDRVVVLPPTEEELRQPPRPKGKHSKAPSSHSSAEKLRAFAIKVAGATESEWARAVKLRNQLVHGKLNEDRETRRALTLAIPCVRRTIVTALKTVIGIPENVPPFGPARPAINIDDVQFVFGSVIKFQEPDAGSAKPPRW